MGALVPDYLVDDEEDLDELTPEERLRRAQVAGASADDDDESGPVSPTPPQPEPAMDDSGPGLSWTKRIDPANGKPIAAPPPSGVDKAATDYEAALGGYPVKPEPKWYQRLAAAAVGGAAGWSNAAGRARPIDAQAVGENILAPGYKSKLESWRSRVVPAQAKLELETQRAGEARKGAESTAKTVELQAQTKMEQQHGDYWENRGNQERNQWKIDPKSGQLFNTITGQVTARPPTVQDRQKTAKSLGFNDESSRVYALTGKLPVERATKNMSPTDVLMHPEDFTHDQVKNAQTIFDREHKPATVNVNTGGEYPKPPGDVALSGDAYLKSLPVGMQRTVKAIADGRERPISGYALTNPKGQGMAIMNAVNQYDPSWSEQRAELRKSFAAGPEGRNIGALNTATVHLDRWHEAAKAMNNGSWQPGNQLWNYVATKFGADAPTNHAFVLNALASESASALKGNATDPEIAHVLSTLQPNLSPQQAQGVAEEGLRIFGDKLNTYDERYHQVAGADDQWSPVLPSARSVFQRYKEAPIARQQGGGAPAANPNPNGYIAGHIYGGLTYLGGDPKNQASWKK